MAEKSPSCDAKEVQQLREDGEVKKIRKARGHGLYLRNLCLRKGIQSGYGMLG